MEKATAMVAFSVLYVTEFVIYSQCNEFVCIKWHEYRVIPEMGVTFRSRRERENGGPSGPTELPGNNPILTSPVRAPGGGVASLCATPLFASLRMTMRFSSSKRRR